MAIDLGPDGLTLGSTTISDWDDVGGKVIQFVNGTVRTANDDSTSSTPTEVNSIYRTAITPTSTSSKILVQFFGHFATNGSTSGSFGLYVSTDGGSSFSKINAGNGNEAFRNVNSNTNMTSSTVSYIHEPNTTSEVIYTPYFWVLFGSTFRINDNPMGSYMQLWEIGG